MCFCPFGQLVTLTGYARKQLLKQFQIGFEKQIYFYQSVLNRAHRGVENQANNDSIDMLKDEVNKADSNQNILWKPMIYFAHNVHSKCFSLMDLGDVASLNDTADWQNAAEEEIW